VTLSRISSTDCGEGMDWPPVGVDSPDGGLDSVEESSGVVAIAAVADVPLSSDVGRSMGQINRVR